jgi:GT2 family glycosyltransferase
MVMAAKERGNLGIFSPLHLSYDGQNVDPIFAKNVIGKSTEVINDLWKGRLARTYRVEEISGASMMMHRDVVEAIGMMDELFFMYGEDGDYCRKARCAGINLYMVPLAVVRHWHTIAHPANGPSPADLFFERSELVYLLKDPNQTFVKRVMRVTWCSSRTFWNNFRHGRIRGAVKSIWTYLSVIMLLPDIEKSWRLDCRMIQKAIRRSQE